MVPGPGLVGSCLGCRQLPASVVVVLARWVLARVSVVLPLVVVLVVAEQLVAAGPVVWVPAVWQVVSVLPVACRVRVVRQELLVVAGLRPDLVLGQLGWVVPRWVAQVVAVPAITGARVPSVRRTCGKIRRPGTCRRRATPW